MTAENIQLRELQLTILNRPSCSWEVFGYLSNRSANRWPFYEVADTLLPKMIQMNMYKIILAVVVAILLFLNENWNCHRMLSYSKLPYHILPEISLIVVFYLICKNLGV